MVTPDGAPTKPGRRTTGRLTTFVVAALIVVVGLFVLGRLTPAEPEAATFTTTVTTTTSVATVDRPTVGPQDFTIADVARGDPLEWSHTTSIDGYLLDLIEHDGRLYLFSAAHPLWLQDPGRVDVSRSSDGVRWEELGSMSESDMKIYRAESTTDGIVAFGVSDDSSFGAWQSTDGRHWSYSPIASTGSNGEVFYPYTSASNGNLMVVAGSLQLDSGRLIQQVVEDATGETIEVASLRSEVEGGELLVRGPLDIPLLRIPIDELGLSEQQRGWLTHGWGPEDTRVWASADGVEWDEGTIEAAQWIDSLFALDDKRVVALGYGWSGNRSAWVSFGGIHWEPLTTTTSVQVVQRWGDRFVGVDNSGARLVVSQDAETWEDSPLRGIFPGQIQWNIYPLAAGEAGVAMVMNGFRPSTAVSPQPQPLTLSQDGVSLILDLNAGSIRIESGDTVYQWHTHNSELPDGVEVDIADQQLIVDRSSEETLATFSFDALTQAEERYWNTCCPGDEPDALRAFVFSPDAEQWTIQEMPTAPGMSLWIDRILVMDHRIVATASGNGRPGIQIWSAPIP